MKIEMEDNLFSILVPTVVVGVIGISTFWFLYNKNNSSKQSATLISKPPTPVFDKSEPNYWHDPEEENEKAEGLTKFMKKCYRGNFLKLQQVLNQPNFDKKELELKTKSGWTAIHLAALNNHKKIVELLLDKFPELLHVLNPNNDWNLLHVTVSKGYTELSSLLINRGININAVTTSNQTPLLIASANGHLHIVKMLLEKKANPNEKTKGHRETALHFACLNGHEEIVKLLLQADADIYAVSLSGANPLHHAAFSGHVGIVSLLLEHNAKQLPINNSTVNICSMKKRDGSTPLHLVMLKPHGKINEIVSLLIKYGADPLAKDTFGRTSLHMAASRGSHEMLAALLSNSEIVRKNIDALDDDGHSALHTLCSGIKWIGKHKSTSTSGESLVNPPQTITIEDYLESTKVLLKFQANINLLEYCTPLHIAVLGGPNSIPLVQLLLENGADSTIENSQGWSCLHGAMNSEERCHEIVDLITKHLQTHNPAFLQTFDPKKPRKIVPEDQVKLRTKLTIEERTQVLNGDLSLNSIIKKILSSSVKNIVFLIGSGISVSAGIPDFRNPTSGFYSSSMMQRFNLPSPSAAFDPAYLRENPEPFFAILKEFFLPVIEGKFLPTPSHYFMKKMCDRGIVRRIYTQNIDLLEHLSGIPSNLIIEAHGSFSSAYCMNCRTRVEGIQEMKEKFWNSISKNEIPYCKACMSNINDDHSSTKTNGKVILRPDVVFFGETLPDKFVDNRTQDLKNCDLLIIMGTSLMVYPFAGLVNEVPETTPRLFINKNGAGPFKYLAPITKEIIHLSSPHPFNPDKNFRDVFYQGDCDEAVKYIEQALEEGMKTK